MKGKSHSLEARRKISEAHAGKKRPKISEALKGKKNPFYGKTHSPETRRKISEANKGKTASQRPGRKCLKQEKGDLHRIKAKALHRKPGGNYLKPARAKPHGTKAEHIHSKPAEKCRNPRKAEPTPPKPAEKSQNPTSAETALPDSPATQPSIPDERTKTMQYLVMKNRIINLAYRDVEITSRCRDQRINATALLQATQSEKYRTRFFRERLTNANASSKHLAERLISRCQPCRLKLFSNLCTLAPTMRTPTKGPPHDQQRTS